MKYEFDENLDGPNQCQPIEVRDQGEFVALIQWDGAGEFVHHVLIPKNKVADYCNLIREMAR